MGSLRTLAILDWNDSFEPIHYELSDQEKIFIENWINCYGHYVLSYFSHNDLIPLVCNYGLSQGYQIKINRLVDPITGLDYISVRLERS